MFVHHPLDMEFFDYDEFERSNYDLIQKLAKDAASRIPGSWSDEETCELRATLITLAIFNNLTSIQGEIEIDPETETHPLIEDFCHYCKNTCFLMHLEQIGAAEHSNEGWKLTSFGEQNLERSMRKKEILSTRENEEETD